MFDNIVYLNRDQDLERRMVTEEQLAKYGAKATRFSAIIDDLESYIAQSVSDLRVNFAQASCLISHLEIIRRYGKEPLLVFEDDVDLSPSEYWGCSLDSFLTELPKEVDIVQLYTYPTDTPILPKRWAPGTFGTVAYYIRPEYSQKLVDIGYSNGVWDVKAFKSLYPQPLADSLLYTNGSAVSLTLFGLRNIPSTILPQATYPEVASKFGQSWSQGLNNSNTIKEALRSLKVARV